MDPTLSPTETSEEHPFRAEQPGTTPPVPVQVPLNEVAAHPVLTAADPDVATVNVHDVAPQPTTETTQSGRESADSALPVGADSTVAPADLLLERVHEQLAAFHTRAQQYEENNRLLHTRVEALQQDQVRSLLKPVFERLATLQAQCTEFAESARDRDSASASDFEYFSIAMDELLALYDVESVGAKAGAAFDAKVHHGARTLSTSTPELGGTIQRVQRQGYKFAGAERVLLPARVSVYRYTAPLEVD